jgi:uncharacterized protein YdbL (DUF1318 family)
MSSNHFCVSQTTFVSLMLFVSKSRNALKSTNSVSLGTANSWGLLGGHFDGFAGVLVSKKQYWQLTNNINGLAAHTSTYKKIAALVSVHMIFLS